MSKTKPIRVGIVGLGRAGWGMHCGELASRGDEFEIVAACDVEKARCDRMAEKYGVQYPVLLDPTNQVLGLFDVKSMPTSYLVDRRGKIVEKKIGFGTAEATLPKVRELVEPHL